MTKERLRRYQSIKAEKKQLELLLEDALAAIDAAPYEAPVQKLTGMPQAHAPGGGSRQERASDKRSESNLQRLVDFYTRKKEALAAEQLAIETAIGSLEDSELRQLMRYKYIDGMKWEEVCLAIGYEWAQTHRKHAKALKLLREVD